MIAENAITNVVELDTDHTPHLSMTGAWPMHCSSLRVKRQTPR